MKRLLLSIAIFVLILALFPTISAFAEEKTTDEQAVQTVEVGIPVEEHPELFLQRSMPTHGDAKIAVFLIEFPDCKNENPVATQEYYERTYFAGGAETNWGNDVSVASFYRDQSYGKLNISGRVFDWYTAKHERSYYDNKKPELIMEAAEHYMAQGVNFSDFDGNGDDVIDAVAFHFAGEYSDNRDNHWYSGTNYGVGGAIGDLQFTRIAQIYEGARNERSNMIDVICHELMHSLGMPDLYGEVYSGMAATLDLMSDNRNTINPYLKMMLGWIDEVQVVTGEVNDLRLDIYGDKLNGDYAIVTDSFDGMFDEFYLVAYREYAQYKTAVIWHIDARLNDDGTGFMNANLYYDPRPDKKTAHSIENSSPYLFIEEICANVDRNFVLNYPWSFEDSAFNPGVMLSPDALPSSDWNGGVFSGIKIDDFTEHDDKYITFDVSFVEDKSAPLVTTGEKDLEFKDIITLKFNENIYEGENWDGVKITDPDGNIIDASIILPHYPSHELEITFKTKAYEKGYQIKFPEGAVCDSSGNKLEAKTLVASTNGILFPSEVTQIVGTGDFTRNNSFASFFPYDDSLVVITELWERIDGENIPMARIEFMRLDYNGNVLKQSIVKNPFERSDIVNVIESGDGSYIFICREEASSGLYDLLFCIDKNGELKWVNDSLRGSGMSILVRDQYKNFYTDGGAVVYCQIGWDGCLLYIDSKTGEAHPFEIPEGKFDLANREFFHLYNGTALALSYDSNGINNYIRLNIVNLESFEVIKYTELVHPLDTTLEISLASVNDDGSLFIVYSLFSNALDRSLYASLFNSSLFEIKTIRMRERSSFDSFYTSNIDGFFDVNRTNLENHGHGYFTVTRYDQYLNQAWKTDIIANFTYFFKTPTKEILCYKSMCDPERECYIVSYGSENDYVVPHVHNISYIDAVEASCTERGSLAHWYCPDCGGYFSDAGTTRISDGSSLFLPKKEHSIEIIPAIPATCVSAGYKEGQRCSECGETLVEPQRTNQKKHSYVWVTEIEPTCTKDGLEYYVCTECKDKRTEQVIPANDKYHVFGGWTVTKKPTYDQNGEEAILCTVCGKTSQTRSIDKLSSENPSTNASASGCGGTISIGATVLVTLISTCALIFKKKEDLSDI